MIRDILENEINEYFLKIYLPLIDKIESEYLIYLNSLKNVKLPESKKEQSIFIINHLVIKIREFLDDIDKLNRVNIFFKQEFLKTNSKIQQDKILLDYAERFGSLNLNSDRKALKRFLDDGAISDRYKKRVSKLEYKIAFYLERIGKISYNIFELDLPKESYFELWNSLEVEKILIPLLIYQGDFRVLTNLMQMLLDIFKNIPEGISLTTDKILKFIYRSSLDTRVDIWIQIRAIELLEHISKDSLKIVLKKRLTGKSFKDDSFIKHRCIKLLAKNLETFFDLKYLLFETLKDKSPHTKQAVAKSLKFLDIDDSIKLLRELIIDCDSEVRALALLQITPLLDEKRFFKLKEILKISLKDEIDTFVLKVALKVVSQSLLKIKNGKLKKIWYREFLNLLKELKLSKNEIQTKREISKTLEQIYIYQNFLALFRALQNFTQNMPLKKRKKLPIELKKYKIENIARALGVISQNDFSYQIQIKKDIFITKGDIFEPKTWRIIYEFLNPAPDKREAHSHIVGRFYDSDVLIQSEIMYEVTKTKVLGEPFLIENEGSYRPFLPLLDQINSTLNSWLTQKEITIFSSEGVTKIASNPNIFKRIASKIAITFKFKDIAPLRDLNSNRYIKEVEKRHFKVDFTPNFVKDISNTKFFSLFFLDSDLYTKLYNYFFSVYQNSIFDLTIFIVVLLSIFFSKHFINSFNIKKYRKAIPFIVGGWGSRGKSGTERLKASLFNALGFSMVSKTTGCEAMFLYSWEFGELNELFLFRPYDKATIWEQYNLVKISSELKSDIFLWECMGLTPQYVKILQKEWMRDDISTITNTYPDHEDLQGPAGVDIPEVMTEFIPKNSKLITSEEIMNPILEEYCKSVDTEFEQITYLEANLLPKDLLKRFPYEEHPYNIALIAKLAKDLGIDEDFAIKEMADNMVSDIGVLKAFPVAKVGTKAIEFINGMSANERFAALNNYKRMQLNITQPKTFVSLLINNRADRVARSKVFAKIVAEDIIADRYFFIGTNLTGFIGYFEESFNLFQKNLTLFSEESNPKELFLEYLKKFQIPETKEQLETLDIEDAEYKKEIEQSFEIAEKISKMFDSKTAKESIDIAFREFYYKTLKSRFVTIDNPHILGDEITQIILNHTPKGFLNRLLGMQNIKGAGLDFVYSQIEWERCYYSSQKLQNRDQKIANEGLKELTSVAKFPLVSKENLKRIIDEVKKGKTAQSEYFQSELQNILLKLNSNEITKEKREKNRFVLYILEKIELFLDAKDAVKRRQRADLIYKDLINEQISIQRAIIELKAINKRQKGGWFVK